MKRIAMVFLLLIPVAAFGGENSKAFYDGVSQYDSGHYEGALAQFMAVAGTGIENGKLAYNIGNTWMQKGDLGNAILWYERALRLMPRDPDLIFNRNVALAQVTDRQEASENPVLSVLFFWKKGLTLNALQWLAIGSGLIFWVLCGLQLFLRRPPFKALAMVFGALFALFASTALWDTVSLNHTQRGVILPQELSVRSGLSETATELFILHAGSRVVVEQERSGWVRIAFSEGKIGWVKRGAVGVI